MKRFAGCVLVSFTLAFAGGPVRAGQKPAEGTPADPAAARDQRVSALQTELEKLRLEMEGLRKELQRLREEAAGSPGPDLAVRLAAIEQRQGRIESELARLAEELKQTGEALDQVSENDRRRPTITVYGTLQASKYRGRDSILDAEAFEIVLSGRPHPRLSFFAEIEFERAASVGGPRGGEIVVEQAYVSYSFASLLSLRTGVLLVPFGNVNVDHFAPLRDVVRKPLVSYAVAPSDWTDNGLQLTGRKVLGTAWLVEYEASLVAGLGADITSAGTRAARQGFGVDNNDDKALVGRLAVKRRAGFEAGLSGYTGRYDDENQRRLNGWAADLRAEIGPLRLTGEYDHFTAERGRSELSHLRGYYVRASYDLRGSLLRALAPDFEDPRLTLVAQYDQVRIDGPAPATAAFERNRETGLTFGLAWRPSRQWVAKINYERNKATGRALDRGTLNGWLGSVGFVF